jgi:hypothetical protein
MDELFMRAVSKWPTMVEFPQLAFRYEPSPPIPVMYSRVTAATCLEDADMSKSSFSSQKSFHSAHSSRSCKLIREASKLIISNMWISPERLPRLKAILSRSASWRSYEAVVSVCQKTPALAVGPDDGTDVGLSDGMLLG